MLLALIQHFYERYYISRFKALIQFYFSIFLTGIGILGLLFLKNVGLIVGLGCAFFRRPGYLLDGIVVMVALFLEAYLEKNGGGLLVVVSLWRVVRVVESAFELSDEAMEAQIEEIVCQFEELKEENKRLMDSVVEKDKQIQILQQELDQYKKSTY